MRRVLFGEEVNDRILLTHFLLGEMQEEGKYARQTRDDRVHLSLEVEEMYSICRSRVHER